MTRVALIITTAVTLHACTAEPPGGSEWMITSETLPDGVVRVTNVPPASGIEPTWVIQPEVVIGSIDDEGPDLFGEIKGIAPLPDGRIAVLDAQAREIRIFGYDGEHVRTLGGRGEGPGELSDPNGMLAGPDGILRVHDVANRRLSLFDPDRGFVGSERIDLFSYGWIWNAVMDSLGRIHEPTLARLGEEMWNVIKTYDARGVWSDTVRLSVYEPRPPDEWRGSFVMRSPDGRVAGGTVIPFWPGGARALDPRGYFWGKRPDVNDYRFAQTTFGGDTLLVVENHRAALPVSSAERDSAIAAIRERTGQQFDWSRIPHEKPIVQAMFLDDAGRIWVAVYASENERTYDVFGRGGRYVGTAVTDLRTSTSLKPVVIGDRFYTIHTGDLGEPYVVQARIRTVTDEILELPEARIELSDSPE